MKIKLTIVGLFVCFATSAWAQMIAIPNGAVVVVKTTTEIKGNTLQVGQMITDLAVAMPVKVNDVVVIKAGTPVIAQVTTAEENGMVGQAGKISISLQSTTAIDGTMVPLTGALNTKADSEMGGTVAASVILCPLFLLNKGDEAVIPSGHQSRAMTLGKISVETN